MKIYLEAQDHRVHKCVVCRAPETSERVVQLPCNNSDLPGYTEALNKARRYYWKIVTGKEGKYVKRFFPDYPSEGAPRNIRARLRERERQEELDQFLEDSRVDEERRLEAAEQQHEVMRMFLAAEGESDDDPSPDYYDGVEVVGVVPPRRTE